MSVQDHTPIALALSGGGIRAMVFHAGLLKAMAERQRLEQVEHLSTVSGGSLLIGLVMQQAGMRWPSSTQYLDDVYPALRERLTSRSLQWDALRQLLKPTNWRYGLTRANLLAIALKADWHIDALLSDVPATPDWSINGTTAEGGKRFRFKAKDIGDYLVGYADPGRFQLASALAVSAAFPAGFGPLGLDTTQFNWRKRAWDAPWSESEPVNRIPATLHLYDGGLYDNLGLEPFFDAGRGVAKVAGCRIVVSDAGAPLPKSFDFAKLSLYRLKRVADIMASQGHALRVRTFVSYLSQEPGRGSIHSIDTPVADGPVCESQAYASHFPTTLRRLKLAEFDRLAEHAYRVYLKGDLEQAH